MKHTRIPTALLCTLLFCSAEAIAQDNVYSRITPLEAAVSGGTATRAQQLELARLYSQVGRYYEASKIAGGLLAIDANDAEAVAVRDGATKALRALADKKVAEAEANAHRAGSTDQDRLALADAYFEAGSYGAAAEQYGRLPESLVTREVRLRQARALAWSGQMDASERIYAQLSRQQRTPEVDLEYGRLLSWMGASHAAVKSLDDVYRANPTQESAVALANARAWSGDREGAIRLLEDFTSNNADAAEARQLLAGMRVAPELRLERVDKLIDLEPYNLALHVDRARLLADTTRYGEALKEIRTVREHSDQDLPDLDALEQRVRGLRDQELARAEERRKALDGKEAKNADEILALAKIYAGLEEYDKAINLYEDYLRVRPDDLKVRTEYARVLGWDRRYTASARQYEKLIEQNPDRADLRLEYAQILSYDSNFAGAVHMFSSLTDISDNPRANLYTDVPSRAHFNLGQIYRWYGWNDHAVEEQNRALSIDSSYVPARNELDLVRRVRPTSNVEAR
ncbi:MAG: Tetratricopeptide repeat protein [Acidobacteria bacterium]|nr:Tetratricopeptide repeat protein [Acidobacteriota bacterium]